MSDLHESAHGVSEHVTLGFVLGWIFGTIMGIAGIIMLCQSSYRTSGVFFVLVALVALPPAQTFLKRKASISISGVFRTALVIVLCFISIAMLPSENGALANNTDTTTDDAYTTVAGQTVYLLKHKYTGDFYVTLDGKSIAFTDDAKADPKQYQAIYNNATPSIMLTADPGNGHTLKVFENSASVTSTDTQQAATPQEQAPSIGDIAYLRIPWAPSKPVLAADTTDDFNEMFKLMSANDTVGVAKMVTLGQVYILSPNTEVRVIDSSFQSFQLVYQVRIMSGDNFGNAAWIQGDLVSATSTTATTTADE